MIKNLNCGVETPNGFQSASGNAEETFVDKKMPLFFLQTVERKGNLN